MDNRHNGCPNWIMYLDFKKFTLLIPWSETDHKRDIQPAAFKMVAMGGHKCKRYCPL